MAAKERPKKNETAIQQDTPIEQYRRGNTAK